MLVLAPTAAAQGRAATACDPFASRACLMPFPNDMNLTVNDRKSPTGLRLRLPANAMPANKDGKRITVAEYNRQDGFSPGQSIVVRVTGLNTASAFKRSRLVPLGDLGQSFAKRAGVVVINARTRKRQLIYAELDANAKRASDKMLLIHPGENFDEGARYIVALRGLRTSSGKRIKASKGFRALKRGNGPKRLRKRYKGIFKTLKRAGIAKSNLTLAWDFTVASEKGLTARMLHIRNDAFAQLGDRNLADGKVEGSAPQYTITKRRRQPRPADPAPHLRHVHRAVLPQRAGLPARRDVQLREQGQGRAARPSGPATRRPRSSSARSRSPRRPRPRTPRSTATACSAAPTRSTGPV